MKTLEEIKKLDLAKLIEELRITKNNLVKIELEIRTGHEKDNQKRGRLRKLIAQMETVKHDKIKADSTKQDDQSNN